MKEDQRIIFLQNKVNKGALFTKTRGILIAKGKYVMTLDEDDLYASNDAFSILYDEAEKNDLDIVGFGSIINF
jgi:glycosyltransferase involved in cell wall biosynthesis